MLEFFYINVVAYLCDVIVRSISAVDDMGVSGATVWCVTNDILIPFHLDAVKLSGTVTKAHWESVTELIHLLTSNRLVLKTGPSIENGSEGSDSGCSGCSMLGDNEGPTTIDATRSTDDEPIISRNPVTFNLATNSLHCVFNNLNKFKSKSEGDASEAVERKFSLCLPRTSSEVTIIHSDDTESLSSEKDSQEKPSAKYVPQETPNWLKLLQKYHDSKRLEKQIQRQREAWARNKRNLRRESVPKCVSGLSR